MKQDKVSKDPILEIYTLGDFDVKIGNQSVFEDKYRSYKIFYLFQYFITFRNRKLLPETIIENLWPENESDDPKNVLRTQIFRLRKTLKRIIPEYADESKYFHIAFANGYYIFHLGELGVLDIREFEKFIAEGDKALERNSEEAINLYNEAIRLYKGNYLMENSQSIWLIPIRNHYNRLYIKTLFKLIDLLKDKDDYSDIIELCEEAILIEPYEEALHIYLMEAMLKIGQVRNAMSHYEYISSVMSREMGIKSSRGLKNVYRKIQSYYDEKSETDIKNIKVKLEESVIDGALLCDSDYFKFLFNVQKRKGLRDENPGFISLITLNFDYKKGYGGEELNKITKIITGVLKESLRKGDVFSFWNDTQILIMLNGAKESNLKEIEKRIWRNFNSIAKTNVCDISIKFLPMISEESIV